MIRRYSGRQLGKLCVIGLCLTVVCLSYSYTHAYPLRLGTTSFLDQVPFAFWVGVVIGIGCLVVAVQSSNNVGIALLATVAFYLLFHATNLLYYSVDMSDAASIGDWLFALDGRTTVPSPSSPEYFEYLQWPLHHAYVMFFETVFDLHPVPLLVYGYFLFVIVLAVAVVAFCYTHGRQLDPFHVFSAAALYLVAGYYILNNQFVPQMLSLCLLFFLFSIHQRRGRKWTVLKTVLYACLLLSHPFLFGFYILSIGLTPFGIAIKKTLSTSGDRRTPVWVLTLRRVRSPVSTLARFASNVTVPKWVLENSVWSITVTVVYLSLLVYQFQSFPLKIAGVFTHVTPSDQTGNPFTIILRVIPGPVRDLVPFFPNQPPDPSAVQTVLLYQYVSENLNWLTRHLTLVLVFGTLALLLASQLLQKWEDLSAYDIAIATGGLTWFSLGSVLPLLASRALQIVFLPLVTAIGAFTSRGKGAKLLVSILLISSPLLLGNVLINQSLVAGGNTEDFHTAKAGERMEPYATQTMIIPNRYTVPADRNPTVVAVDRLLNGYFSPSARDLVVDSTPFRQFVHHRVFDCDFDSPHHVVYDNTARVIWLESDFQPFDCRRPSGT